MLSRLGMSFWLTVLLVFAAAGEIVRRRLTKQEREPILAGNDGAILAWFPDEIGGPGSGEVS
jgi:hypothetical protein